MSLADILAHGKGGSKEPPMPEDDGEGSDPKMMAEEACKAFYEACKAGDFATAAEHLSAAVEHCKAYGDDDGDEPEGGHAALMLIPHGKGG